MKSLTADTFFNGKLLITQGACGYRYSIDAVVLAHLIDTHAGEKIVDLGTGCGIIPLLLAYRNADIHIYGIEIQDELADLATSNVKANQMQDRITVLCRDMRELKPRMIGGPADVIVCNPPYRKPNSGRLNPNRQKAVARHEIRVSLIDVLRTVRSTLRTAGRFVTVYTAERSAELLSQMHLEGIEPKFIRTIHSQVDVAAKLILVVGIKGARAGAKIGPPLIIYDATGQYSAEIQKMFIPEDD